MIFVLFLMIELELTHDFPTDLYNFFTLYFEQLEPDEDHDLDPMIIKTFDYLRSLHSCQVPPEQGPMESNQVPF